LKKSIYLFIALSLFLSQNIFSQSQSSVSIDTINPNLIKYAGFIGLYHNSTSTVYGGFGWPTNQLLQRAFNFGINLVMSCSTDLGYTFQANIDSNCTAWDANKIYGLILPPSEHGPINQPGDSSLFYPYSYNSNPGMIQAAHRFSELSKTYPQIRGAIIDDFFENYPAAITYNDLQEIKDALLGKTVESSGTVDHNSEATTPNLKLFIVLYQSQLNSSYLSAEQSVTNLIDGVNFWISNQSAYYEQLDSNLTDIKTNIYPNKKIITGIYFDNSHYNGMSPQSINYLFQRSIDLYDQGKISGTLLFSGAWITEQFITQARWDSLALPQLFDSLYYPYMGEGNGRVVDAGGYPITHALVTVDRIINGDTIVVAEKYTQSNGGYDFSSWAGKDSLINYEVSISASTSAEASINVTLQAQKDITLPDITLQTVAGLLKDESNIPKRYSLDQNYPNPFNPSTVISYSLPKESNVVLKIYNILGQEVLTLINKFQAAGNYKVTFNDSSIPSGVYFYKLNADNFNQVKKMLLVK